VEFGAEALVAEALAAGCMAMLVWFGTGLHPWWPLMWLAPLPALVIATRSTWVRTLLVAFAGFFIGGLNLWHYLHDVLSAPALVLVLEFALQALLFALVILLFRALYHRQAWALAMVGFPAAWASIEYLVSLVWVHGTAGDFAYTQLDNLPALQTASVTGPWGITFLVLLLPASLVILPRAPRLASGGLSTLLVACLFGTVRLNHRDSDARTRVGLVASDVNRNVADEGPPTVRLLKDYASQARQLAAQGAEAIVLPEKLGVLVGADTAATDAMFQSIADQHKTRIVVGVIRVISGARYNQARIYSPGAAVETYDKEHMLPPYESKLTPGTTLTLLSNWGVAICKDMDFTAPSRPYGEAGARVLLVPAWDFDLDRWSHGHMAIMRGVENGFSIVRAARQGYLTVSDNRGRVVAEARSDAAPFSTLITDVPLTHGGTLYEKAGDWFAWLMLAIFAAALIRVTRLARIDHSLVRGRLHT